MRKMLMTAALVIMLVLPVLAQFRGGGFGRGGGGGRDALMNKSVQEELKLDDKQKKAITEISKKQREAFTKAFEYGKDGEKDKAKETMTKAQEATKKALADVRKGLTSTQSKRLAECEVQIAVKHNDLNIFKNEAIVKALKLSDKQKDKLKGIQSDLEKDIKEVFEEGGRENFRKNIEKAGKLRTEAFTKATKSLTDDQAKAWKDAAGEKFDYKEDTFGGGKGKGKFGKGKGKGKGKAKDDDL